MKGAALINGHIVDAQQPVIDMLDRGYMLGDGVYEVTPFFNGKCFGLIPHLERLFYSLKEIQIPAVYTMEELIEFHERLIAESDFKDGAIYLQVTRGSAPERTHFYPDKVVPCLTMHSFPLSLEDINERKAKGVACITHPDIRWLRCDIKSISLLGAAMAKQKAHEANAYEAILYRENGVVTECSSSNFMVVKDGVIWTHPKNNYILNGINRRIIMERLLKECDLTVVEKTFDMDFVHSAQEAFATSSSCMIMPIVSIDGKAVGDGTVGPISKKLISGFDKFLQQECYGKD